MKVFLKNLSIYSFATIINALLGLVLIAYLTNLLTTTDFGQIGMYQVILNFLIPVISLSLPNLLNKEFFNLVDLKAFISSSLLLILIIGALMTAVYLLIYMPLSSDRQLVVLLALISATVTAATSVLLCYFQMSHKAFTWASITISSSLTAILTTFILIAVDLVSFKSRIGGLLIGQLVSFLVGAFIYFRHTPGLVKFNFSIFLKKWKSILALMTTALSGVSLLYADRFFIENYIDIERVGIYTLAVLLVSPLVMLITTFSRVWAPIAYKLISEGKIAEYIRKSLTLTIAFVVICIFYGFVSIWVYPEIIGADFQESIELIPYLCIPTAIMGSYYIFQYIVIYEKNVLLALTAIVAFLVGLTLNYYLIPIFGVRGAVLSNVTSNVVILLAYLVFVFFRFKKVKEIS